MRTIKFRAIQIYGKGWIYGDLHIVNPVNIHMHGVNLPCAIRVIPETIGQFTGRTDENGVEIYEGDMVKINTHFHHIVPANYNYKYEDEKGHAIYQVKWHERDCKFYLEFVSCTKVAPSSKILDVHSAQEVIGNIHEIE